MSEKTIDERLAAVEKRQVAHAEEIAQKRDDMDLAIKTLTAAKETTDEALTLANTLQDNPKSALYHPVLSGVKIGLIVGTIGGLIVIACDFIRGAI